MNITVITLVLLSMTCVNCQYKKSQKSKHRLQEVRVKLHHMTRNVRSAIKQYGKEHSVYKAFDFPRVDFSARCSGKTRAGYTPARIRAIEIMKILQEFIGEMQQLQMDESHMPKGSHSLTKHLRQLEFQLRDFTEHSFRKMARKVLGTIIVPYSLGTLPSKERLWMDANRARKMHLLSLYQLLHCLTDVRRASKAIWRGYYFQNSTKDKFSKF